MRFTDAEQNALRDVTAISTSVVAARSLRSSYPKAGEELEGSTRDRILTPVSLWKDRPCGRRSMELARLLKAGLVSEVIGPLPQSRP